MAEPDALWPNTNGVPPYQSGHSAFVVGMILQDGPGARIEVSRVLGNDGFADSWSVVASEGGIPLMRDGKIIGAIGCSGGTSQQDGQVCKAGVDTIK